MLFYVAARLRAYFSPVDDSAHEVPFHRMRVSILTAILFALAVFAPRIAGAEAALDMYGREGCLHCLEAHHFLKELAQERPGLTIVEHDVTHDAEALRRLRELTERAGITTPGVPTFVVGETVIVGFQPQATPARIRALLDGDRASMVAGEACLSDPTKCEKPEAKLRSNAIDLPLVGRVTLDAFGLPLFTIIVGLVDGFNPCATWVLLFLLSMLVNLKSRSRMALIAGTFVIVSGLVYFAFMAAWLTFFMVIGISQPLRIAIAGIAIVVGSLNVKNFFAWGRGPSLSIPESAKPGIYTRVRAIIQADNLGGAMVGIVVLAFLVNLVELLCTAGLPALYTAILTGQGLPSWKYYAYLALYIAAYMFDDAILVTIGVVTLGKRKLQERGGRWLKLLSGLMILLLGVVLLVRPTWLGM